MKFGFFGGAILLILTLIFSYLAIQNNKMSREITMNAFDLKPQQLAIEEPKNSYKEGDKNETNSTVDEPLVEAKLRKVEVETKSNRWDKFDEKFKDFDKKFEDF